MPLLEGVHHSWDYLNVTPQEINKRAEQLISKTRVVYEQIGNFPEAEVGVENVLKALQEAERAHEVEGNYLVFPQHTFPDKEIRDASMEADKKISEFDVEISMHQGVFNNLLILQKKNPKLDPEDQRFLEKLIQAGRRFGLHLPEDIQNQVKEMKKRMSDISIEFSRNLGEVTTFLEFSNEELKGLPEDFIENLDQAESGKRKVTLKYPHYSPVMRKAENTETRRTLEKAYSSRCSSENTKLLEEMVALRHKLAVMLGFKNHSDYVSEIQMAKSADIVHTFLYNLVEKLREPWQKEKQVLLKFKEAECERLSQPFDKELHAYDMAYYTTMVEEKLFSVDQEQLREYFPMHTVTKGLLGIYQELLSLTFEEISNPPVWHPDVQMFRVRDKTSQELLGYFYMDLFPREGKYGHACCMDMQPQCVVEGGKRQCCVKALVCNFKKPTADKPSLLDHKEVETYFHEFGHAMHSICSKVNVTHFCCTRVERDFVEAPSQMLENWCWAEEPLLRMSGHYKDGSRIPDGILQSLIKSQLANVAHFNMRQLTLGIFDHTIHTRAQSDTTKVYAEVSSQVIGINPSPGTSFPATFEHLTAGYDARYYGYMWSEVYSADMFEARFKRALFSTEAGLHYRNTVLSRGGTKDGIDLLRDFLGREPNEKAFLVSKGLVPSAC